MHYFGILFIIAAMLGQFRSSPIAAPAQETLTIAYIAHSCLILDDGANRIMIDPFASHTWIGYQFPDKIVVDAIFITHPHYDHDGGLFLGKSPYWMCEIPFYQAPKTYEVGNFLIEGIIGKHGGSYGKEFGQMNTIWKIHWKDITIAHLGDNGPLTDANYSALGNVDILMAPIDAQFHILKKDDLEEVLATLNPPVVIPMHYRIPELERPGKPESLGEIDPYLKDKSGVIWLDNDKWPIDRELLSNPLQYVVFKHSSGVVH